MANILQVIHDSLAALAQSKRFLAILSGVVVVVCKAYGWDVSETAVAGYVAMVLAFVHADTSRPIAVKFAWLPSRKQFAENHRRAAMRLVGSIAEKYKGTARYEDAKTELRAKLSEHRTGFSISDAVFSALMQWALAQLVKWMQETILDKDKGDQE